MKAGFYPTHSGYFLRVPIGSGSNCHLCLEGPSIDARKHTRASSKTIDTIPKSLGHYDR
uniref:Uncharacterized protein n=1 Tax=Medicago truncatula TaxID=3880 RepID=A2Q444_MEDTR|nr:hypothetical protein MtrDRAFT_AC155896g10v2 [Medicago truncatula]